MGDSCLLPPGGPQEGTSVTSLLLLLGSSADSEEKTPATTGDSVFS